MGFRDFSLPAARTVFASPSAENAMAVRLEGIWRAGLELIPSDDGCEFSLSGDLPDLVGRVFAIGVLKNGERDVRLGGARDEHLYFRQMERSAVIHP